MSRELLAGPDEKRDREVRRQALDLAPDHVLLEPAEDVSKKAVVQLPNHPLRGHDEGRLAHVEKVTSPVRVIGDPAEVSVDDATDAPLRAPVPP